MLERFQAYLTLYRRSEKTIRSYLDTIRRFFGSQEVTAEMVSAVTPDRILQFLSGLSEHGASPNTINQRLCALKTFFGWCQSPERIIPASPAAEIRRLPTPERAPEFLKPDEVGAAFSSLGARNYERNAALLCVACVCGLRSAEIVALDLSDYQDGALRVVGKGNKERFVATSQAVDQALARWLKKRPKTDCPALFVYPNGERIQKRVLRTLSQQLSKATGLHIHPHLFRHTAGSLAYAATKDIVAVKELLGHARLETTMLYTHLPSEAQRSAVVQNPVNQVFEELSGAIRPAKKHAPRRRKEKH